MSLHQSAPSTIDGEVEGAVVDGVANHTHEWANPFMFKGGNFTHKQLVIILEGIRNNKRLKKNITNLIAQEANKADGCPCLLVEPCSYACSCAKPHMSGGCMRCAKYGSKEQRLKAAQRLARLTADKESNNG